MRKRNFKNYNKPKKKNKTAHNIVEKKHINSKYKHRGNAAVEYLKKQIDLEKKYLERTTVNATPSDEESIESEEDEFQSLIKELSTTAEKHKPSYKERPLTLLNSKIKTKNNFINKNNGNDDTTALPTSSKVVSRLPATKNRFVEHFKCEFNEQDIENLLKADIEKCKEVFNWPDLGQIYSEYPNISVNDKTNGMINHHPPIKLETVHDLENIGIQPTLAQKVPLPLSGHQSELFSLLNVYKDVYYPERNLINGEEVRLVYTLHAYNHIRKARARVKLNDRKLKEAEEKKQQASKQNSVNTDDDNVIQLNNGSINNNFNINNDRIDDDEKYRDQGLAKPKILILVPFRDSAFRIVNIMANIIRKKLTTNDTIGITTTTTIITDDEQKTVMNYKRFVEEYSGDEISFPKKNPKPEDYERTFCGNTDDNFRIGLALTEKTLKLYTDFNDSDILIASPLGLRMTIAGSNYYNDNNNSGNNDGKMNINYDYLTSIEMLIIDQADIILAQNWENLLHVMDHLHLQPKSLPCNNIMRVRSWCLNGLTKFYRQSLIFASHDLPEFRGLFNNKCYNYDGKIRIINPIKCGSIHNVIIPSSIPQQFHRIDVPSQSIDKVYDIRFEYFIKKILPQYQSTIYAHTMIYVPNYFDYIKLRNYMKAENYQFVQICEYTRKEKMARARDMFYHSSAHYLLYSERSHFFKRTRIKGIRHMIMYQPPLYPQFYSEMINFMHTSYQNVNDGLKDSMSITILYTKYDQLQLNGILGSEYTTALLASDKMLHIYIPQT